MNEETKAYIAAWCRFINDNDIPIETDNDGQIVIYTGLKFAENGEVISFCDNNEDN